MRKLFTLLMLTVATALASQALTVNVTPGKLAQVIDDDFDITELVISGSMDARDFLFIAENLNQLTTLDLSNVTIAAYNKDLPVFGTYVNYFGNEIPRTAFFGKPLRTVVLPSTVQGIGYAAFAGCDQLQSVVLPASVTYLEDYAFAGTGLTSIDLPSTINFMGKGVFSRCTALTQATINADFVGSFAFLGDTLLSDVTIGAKVSYINEGAFNGCKALTAINFDPKCRMTSIGAEAFINSGLENLNIKSIGLSSIGDWAFAQTRLQSIALTDGLNSMGMGALAHNPYLTNVELPDIGKINNRNNEKGSNTPSEPTGIIAAPGIPRPNLTLSRISAYAFADDSLLNVSRLLKKGVKTIEPFAFYNNSLEMDTVYLPSTLVYLGDSAMAGMIGMRALKTAAEAVPEVGIDVWAGVDQPSVPLIAPSDESKAEYMVADQWMYFFYAPDFILGDVNNDGYVNIADVSALIDYLLGGTEPINELGADVDEDGKISIADTSALIDMLLRASSSKSVNQIQNELEGLFTKTNDEVTVESTTISAGMTRTIEVSLNNKENNYSAMQFELKLPRGIELTAVEGVDRGEKHNLYMTEHEVENNVYTLISASMGNQQYAGKDGKVLRLTLTATEDFDATNAEVAVTNVLLVGEKSHVFHAHDAMSRLNESTAIEKVTADRQIAKVTYFNVAGLQSDEPFDGMNIVVTTFTDGTSSTVKVIK